MCARSPLFDEEYRWPMPPTDGSTSDDLDRLPGLPPHSELIDGTLVLVGPQRLAHSLTLYVLEHGLNVAAPEDLRVRRGMTVTLGPKQRPEPDILVVEASFETDPTGSETSYPPHVVRLVAEVVSPESEERDRKRKPHLYAEAGIPHFWRVEQGDDGPAVFTYELDPSTRSYHLTGIHHQRLLLTTPFPVDIDLTRANRR
ncbi:Uma2 family endonuclease [Spiractinospora alimapuensis]|uniref:Uma2 family endonuclease n=1 Tax=Spiractinospora alimapuensis TaxID=2820884 RepID=UPI001F344F71|nr:Uma2 family endonuclease [Spiractinospora alimapuensis]QVQ50847.1 Uma2 family endonuclease [Spiractinospora alimapuensis]